MNRNESTTPIVIEIPGDSPLAHSLRECAADVLRTPEAEALWLIHLGLEDHARRQRQDQQQRESENDFRRRQALEKAGLPEGAALALARNKLSPDDVARLTDDQLRTFDGIGPIVLSRIRAVIPYKREVRQPARQGAALSRAWDLATTAAAVRAGLTPGTLNALQRANLSPDDVAHMTDAELLTLNNIGTRSVAQIRAVIPYAGEQDHAEVPA